MQVRAIGAGALLGILSCGPGLPEFDAPSDGTGETATDAADRNDATAGPRVLADVSAPRESDGRSRDAAGGAAGRAGALGVDATVRDGSADGRGSDASDAELDARGRDADVIARPVDASPERGRDGPSLDRGDDAADDGLESARDSNIDASTEIDASAEADASTESDTSAGSEGGRMPPGVHLLISEVVTRPSGAEMIEIVNPTAVALPLSDYLLSDSHLYYRVASGTFTTASGSDFAARFPDGAVIASGQFVVVALGNASGGSISFESTYGQKPDFELRPTANGATDDALVPNMLPAQDGGSIGPTASLTDTGEPVMLFFYRGGPLVADVDYLFFGTPSASNPAVDKTGVVVSGSAYAEDTPEALQHFVPAAPEGGSLHRCTYLEPDEKISGGNGLVGHDETAENTTSSFAASANERTPGRPPPAGLCSP